MVLRIRIEGRVQGVGFRYWAVGQARRHRLDGWVCNLRDGAVELLAQGDPAAIQRLRAVMHQGPPLARVDRIVDLPTGESPDLHGFSIRDPFGRHP